MKSHINIPDLHELEKQTKNLKKLIANDIDNARKKIMLLETEIEFYRQFFNSTSFENAKPFQSSTLKDVEKITPETSSDDTLEKLNEDTKISSPKKIEIGTTFKTLLSNLFNEKFQKKIESVTELKKELSKLEKMVEKLSSPIFISDTQNELVNLTNAPFDIDKHRTTSHQYTKPPQNDMNPNLTIFLLQEYLTKLKDIYSALIEANKGLTSLQFNMHAHYRSSLKNEISTYLVGLSVKSYKEFMRDLKKYNGTMHKGKFTVVDETKISEAIQRRDELNQKDSLTRIEELEKKSLNDFFKKIIPMRSFVKNIRIECVEFKNMLNFIKKNAYSESEPRFFGDHSLKGEKIYSMFKSQAEFILDILAFKFNLLKTEQFYLTNKTHQPTLLNDKIQSISNKTIHDTIQTMDKNFEEAIKIASISMNKIKNDYHTQIKTNVKGVLTSGKIDKQTQMQSVCNDYQNTLVTQQFNTLRHIKEITSASSIKVIEAGNKLLDYKASYQEKFESKLTPTGRLVKEFEKPSIKK